jgi:hypothetical protein
VAITELSLLLVDYPLNSLVIQMPSVIECSPAAAQYYSAEERQVGGDWSWVHPTTNEDLFWLAARLAVQPGAKAGTNASA